MPKLYIKAQYMKMLQDIFTELCPHATVWAYGSRVNGTVQTAHDGSDLDLALEGLELCQTDIYELRHRVKDSNVPFLVDIFDLPTLPQSFQEDIVKTRVEIFPNFEGEYV